MIPRDTPPPPKGGHPPSTADSDREIEIGGINPVELSEYFCSRSEFRDRLHALMGMSKLSKTNLVYGLITLKEEFLDQEELSLDWAEDAIARLENAFIKSVRVPRKFVHPENGVNKKRRSDGADYKKMKGNFDLARRIPSTVDKPHRIEFILYDCDMKSAMEKTKNFEMLALELGIQVKTEVSLYTGQEICNQ